MKTSYFWFKLLQYIFKYAALSRVHSCKGHLGIINWSVESCFIVSKMDVLILK